MELRDLPLFLAAAETENLQHAAKQLRVTPSTLSKAIARLEESLDVRLFHRIGRNIRLSNQGQHLRERARSLLDHAETVGNELRHQTPKATLRIAGPEILLGEYLPMLVQAASGSHRVHFELTTCTDEEVDRQLHAGSHLALTTFEPRDDVDALTVAQTTAKTVICPAHPAFAELVAGPVDIHDVLKHPFVSPARPIFGAISSLQSPDGWRDDKFPRQVDFVAPSLHVMREILQSGLAIGYIPEYLVAKLGAQIINVQGCPYTCDQTVYLCQGEVTYAPVARDLFAQVAKGMDALR